MTDTELTSTAPSDTELESLESTVDGFSLRQLLAPLILAIFWAIAVFVIQELTSGANYPMPLHRALGCRVVRLSLDILACGTITFLVVGWPRYVAILSWATATSAILIYSDYYGRALSWTTITNQFIEGLAMGPYVVELIRWQSFTLVLMATSVLLLLAARANRRMLAIRLRGKIFTAFLACWILVAIASTQLIDRVAKLKTFGSVDRLTMTHGYALTWLAEWWYLDGTSLLLRAKEASLTKQDRLTPLEFPVPLGDNLAIVQIESLDYDVVHYRVDGELVMPFLADLTTRSMSYRISAIHESGSCDADFVMLMNLYPAGDAPPYSVPGFDWHPSLAVRVQASGFESTYIHGNDSSFFNRGVGVGKMGFHQTLFREQLEAQYNRVSKHWGISDQDVFDTSRELFLASSNRAMHFIITLTSHSPFHYLAPKDRELFPAPTSLREQYLNSMRYVDTQLRNYIQALPDDLVVVLYGDHASRVDYGQHAREAKNESVPFLIHKIGHNLARLQKTRDIDIAMSGELTTLDAAGYVWSLFPEPEVKGATGM
ncbi:MAG: hypothetical protein DHS20C16_09260 [Phycisphaerae bacterium]|nr:MAG: hypothetical protein DHS20C16_09260 [Phycisphaerae bacterium]